MAKRCLFCRRWFQAYPPMAARQHICGDLLCRRKLKRSLDRAWRRRDPRWCKAIQDKRRLWAAARKYWRRYRKNNPPYRERERVRMRRRRKRRESVAKQAL